MATGSKRGRKPSAGGSKRNASVKKRQNKRNQELIDEILLFVVIGLSIMMFLAVCGLLGSFGGIIKNLLIGLFGAIGFLFPFVFLIVSAYSISNKFGSLTKVKIFSSILCFVIISCFAQLIFGRKDLVVNSVSDYYTSNWKSGGFFGGLFTSILNKVVGNAGTIVILLVLLVISIILLTDRSFFGSVKEGKQIIVDEYNDRKQYNKQKNEIRDIERQERELQRQERQSRKRAEQEEKRAQQLEARRKKAEEKLAETSERIKFDALDLRRQQQMELELDEVNDASNSTDDEYIEEPVDLAAISGPSSIFYGKAGDYKNSTDRRKTTPSNDDRESVSASSGLLNATKLNRSVAQGEIVEITENYCGDTDFSEYFTSNINTSHKINVNVDFSEDLRMKEAYERDLYVDDEATFNEEYSDVADVISFSKASAKKKNNIPSRDIEDLLNEGSKANITEKTQYTSDLDSNISLFAEPEYPTIGKNEEYPEFSTESVNDLKTENAKPTPVSQIVSTGKAVKAKKTGRYKLPPVTLLDEVKNNSNAAKAAAELNETARELKDTLKSFGLDVTIIGSSRGPAVTRYEIQMPAGVSVKKITNLSDDIMMSLGAKDIRIEAPIPGKKAVGIELPNKESTMVHFRELIDSKEFKSFDSNVAFGVGKDLSGDIVVTDIAKMPHLLIAGATGSGKSVCINTLIMSILFKAKPDEVKLIMVDPKQVELSIYNDIPHLLIPVVTDARKASAALNWAVNEMTRRYQKFAEIAVRDIKGYNSKIQSDSSYTANGEHEFMPQLVIVVDELADLMLVAAKEVEESICRLAQLARAAGIYLILATQRPSVDVITGLIKANMPSRIAFSVTSGVDSRTILDSLGAEKLLGYGDMLFFPRGYNKPSRVQGAFVDDSEVERVVDYIKEQSVSGSYSEEAMNAVNAGGQSTAAGSPGLVDPQGAFDELFVLAGHAVIEMDKASIGMLQRKFKIGFNRAARIMDQLSDEGVVGPEEGTKPRKILMSMEEFNNMLEEKNHQ